LQIVVAEGQNLKGLWHLGDMVDLNMLSSNDIGAIMDTYGVEAGRACIIKEMKNIFGVYVPL
jgi:DNA-directed RNA polymerase I subunit RPA1